MNKKSLTDKAGEVREITRKDLRGFRPIDEVLSPELSLTLRRGRGKQKAPTKVQVTLRLDRSIVDHYRKKGPGWQSKINSTLLRAVKVAK